MLVCAGLYKELLRELLYKNYDYMYADPTRATQVQPDRVTSVPSNIRRNKGMTFSYQTLWRYVGFADAMEDSDAMEYWKYISSLS